MKVRIAGLTAVLALLVATPAQAHFLDKGPVEAAADCNVSYNEAVFITAKYMGGYHGGYLRAGDTLGGTFYGVNCFDRKVGIRAKDNALLYAWVRVRNGKYTLFMDHQ